MLHPLDSSSHHFQLVNVDPQSQEFKQLLHTFNLSLQHNHTDYVISRVKGGKLPVFFHLSILFQNFLLFNKIKFNLRSAVRIENEILRNQFEKCVSDLSLQLEPEFTKTFRGFHGANTHNLEQIAEKGLLKAGNLLNPSKQTDQDSFGNPHHGVYVSICITHMYTFPSFHNLIRAHILNVYLNSATLTSLRWSQEIEQKSFSS